MMPPVFTPACFMALLAAAPAVAFSTSLTADIDGDGWKDTVTLSDYGDNLVVLTIDDARGSHQYFDLVWMGSAGGQSPGLAIAENGSLLIQSMNEGIGRNHWYETLTVAFRQDAYRVAGFTYEWVDTLEPANGGYCDINLLTGNGVLQVGSEPERPIKTTIPAVTLDEWSDEATQIACGY